MDKKTPPAPPQKRYYDIKVETMLPATITYRVLAETPEEAFLLTKTASPTGVQHKLIGRKDRKATVYDAGCSMVRFVKNLMGF